jgi:hypothetical protein
MELRTPMPESCVIADLTPEGPVENLYLFGFPLLKHAPSLGATVGS